MQYFDEFSGNKLSGMDNMLTKFGCQKMVALETVRDSLIFFNARYLRRGSRYCLQFWEFVVQDQRYSLCSEHIFLRIADFQL